MNFDSTSDPPRASILDRWLAMRRRGKGVGGAGAHQGALSDPGEGSALTQIVRRLLEPESGAETAGLVGAGFTPGVGEAMDAGEMYLGAVDKDPVRTGVGALSLAMGPFMNSAGVRAAGPAIKRGLGSITDRLKLWHGSPHKFDEFDISHILSGEGANMAGPGHYLAEAEGTAEYYANNYGRVRRSGSGYDYSAPASPRNGAYSGVHMDDLSPEEVAMSYLDPHYQRRTSSGLYPLSPGELNPEQFERAIDNASGGMDKAVEAAKRRGVWKEMEGSALPDHSRFFDSPMSPFLDVGEAPSVQKLQDARDVLADLTPHDAGDFRRGYLYEVDVDAKPTDFLDLDKPLLSTPTGRNFALASKGTPGMAISEDTGIDIMDALVQLSEEGNIGRHVEAVDDALAEFSSAMEVSLRGDGRIPEDVILRARSALENAISWSADGSTASRRARGALSRLAMDNTSVSGRTRGWLARGLLEGKHGREGLEGLMESSDIAGVRFRDAMSRIPVPGSPPTYNYVVPWDAPLSIRRRYADGGMIEDENVLKRWLSQSRPQEINR
tara:strand:+ start:708 stop:2366 length:1659 start_codon:yes stop_codon:yes gene_type:complete